MSFLEHKIFEVRAYMKKMLSCKSMKSAQNGTQIGYFTSQNGLNGDYALIHCLAFQLVLLLHVLSHQVSVKNLMSRAMQIS